jgi:hypothetical protein
MERYLDAEYGTFPSWRCHLHLADTLVRMVKLYYSIYETDAYARLLKPVSTKIGLNQLLIGDGEVRVNQLHGPALDIPQDRIVAGVQVFDLSLAWLRRRFPALPVTVIYIPSPLSIYRLGGDEVYYMSEPVPGDPPWRRGQAPVDMVEHNSRLIGELVRDASLRQGASFADATRELQDAGASRPVHGPRDWSHLNEAGYRVLGRLVAAALQSSSASPRQQSAEMIP